jgi:hypothetical protein
MELPSHTKKRKTRGHTTVLKLVASKETMKT